MLLPSLRARSLLLGLFLCAPAAMAGSADAVESERPTGEERWFDAGLGGHIGLLTGVKARAQWTRSRLVFGVDADAGTVVLAHSASIAAVVGASLPLKAGPRSSLLRPYALVGLGGFIVPLFDGENAAVRPQFGGGVEWRAPNRRFGLGAEAKLSDVYSPPFVGVTVMGYFHRPK